MLAENEDTLPLTLLLQTPPILTSVAVVGGCSSDGFCLGSIAVLIAVVQKLQHTKKQR